MQIVWFKRDLRIHDHRALFEAAKHGPVIPLYIIEPELWRQPDMSHRHYAFLLECLEELNKELSQLGQPLIIRIGDAKEVFEQLMQEYRITTLHSHQETWNGWTYARDIKIKEWCIANAVIWNEPPQYGIIRGRHDRDGWVSKWYNMMSQPVLPAPERLETLNILSTPIPSSEFLGLQNDGATQRQKGGRREAISLLSSFLNERGMDYTKEMSSPVTAYDSCSRISAHLAFGTISMREVYHASQSRFIEIKDMPRGNRGKWNSAMRSFSARLRWHCHFMQKLEDEPRIEFEPFHSAYQGIRDKTFNETYFEAWKAGKTGYPMVDACMRALIATGWLNFRMRAMVMSFASYHLWLDWRPTSLYLAKLFTDYEPGIHYSQAQMQSGTTGINTIRIYNPIKQSQDQDPEGIFLRKWLPELQGMPQDLIHTPWMAESKMNGYPMPIIDEKTARKQAADKVYAIRRNIEHRQEAQGIVKKHGSRKRTRKRTKTFNKNQAELPL